MPEQRVFVLHGGLEPVQRIRALLFSDEIGGISVKELGRSELGEGEVAEPRDLMRRVDDWAEKKGGGRAYPTFRSTGEGYGKRYEVVQLDKSVSRRFDAPMKDLWPKPFDPNDLGHLFRVVHDHCTTHDFAGGFPNGYWSGEKVPERVVQIVAIYKGRAVEGVVDLPALGRLPEEDLPARFRAVHEWATQNGYAAGMPNFHVRDNARKWGEHSALTGSEQDLNRLLVSEGFRVARVDPIKLSNEQAGLAYLLERS